MNTAGPVSPATRTARWDGPWTLESGAVLPALTVAYRTWGELNPARSNAVLVCHALTGSADADAWWPELLGPGRALDPARDFIVCSNVLGGCYGTTGPLERLPEPRPAPNDRYGARFPRVSVRDMVRVQAALLDRLGVERLALVIGGSLGGMQTLEWAAMYPDRVAAFVPVAVGGRHSPWCIGWSEAQRQAILTDPNWRGGAYPLEHPPAAGLATARMIAMCTYRSPASFAQRFARDGHGEELFAVESYLRHQGRKLVERFDAGSYVTLTMAMDSHDLGHQRGGLAAALAAMAPPALVVGIDSDVLYPLAEQQELADGLPHGQLAVLSSPHGHDAFLLEGERLNALVAAFRAEQAAGWDHPAAEVMGGLR